MIFGLPPTPLTAGLTLVTNNESEFRRVRGLKLQNWAA